MRYGFFICLMIIILLASGCSQSNFSSPTHTFETFQKASLNGNSELIFQTFSEKETILASIYSNSQPNYVGHSKVLKEHIYQDYAELEIGVYSEDDEVLEYKILFDVPLTLEDDEWKFYSGAKDECDETTLCYMNGGECHNSKWTKVRGYDLSSEPSSLETCSCVQNKCVARRVN